MKKKHNQRDPGESKHRFCDPGACNQCINQGGGNFLCKLHNVQVVKDWHNTEYERICKQGRRPQDTAKPAKGKPNGKRRGGHGR